MSRYNRGKLEEYAWYARIGARWPHHVGLLKPNAFGLYDMHGNVAEWIHDFYASGEGSSTTSTLGPTSGEYHVISGSSWMHGTITDLRLAFRDYGVEGRRDVGFRVARFIE